MSVLARRLPAVRYGSAAQLAALTGLSIKTIRRRLRDGSLPSLRLGRRVLIPLDAIDRPPTPELSVMALAPTPAEAGVAASPSGGLRPLTDAERRARTEALGRWLDGVAETTDATDTDEVWREVMRGIDEGRPHRPLFEGSY